MTSSRELTLDEWVGRLPASHRAAKELAALRKEAQSLKTLERTTASELASARRENDRLTEMVQASRRLYAAAARAYDTERLPKAEDIALHSALVDMRAIDLRMDKV